MNFDLRAAIVRLSNSNIEQKGSVYAVDQAVRQFNGLLSAAKKKYKDRTDIQSLVGFQFAGFARSQHLRDSIQRLIDALDVEPDESGANIPILSPKFGILRAESQIEKDFSIYLEDHGGLGLIFFDIDNFKKLNTKYTETRVDREILAPFQHFLLNIIQSRGFAYAVGGDEFIILLRNVSSGETKSFADRLLEAVCKLKFNIAGNEETLTLSIGLACYQDDSTSLVELREMANKAENLAKSTGRNKVVYLSQTSTDVLPNKDIQTDAAEPHR